MLRGEAYNVGRATQVRDFTGLCFDAITPTDIDAFIDFGNRLFVFIEAKVHGAELPRGQRLALERLCDSQRVRTFVLIVSHESPPQEPIDFAQASVVEYRYKRRWIVPARLYSCRALVEGIYRRYGAG